MYKDSVSKKERENVISQRSLNENHEEMPGPLMLKTDKEFL